MVMAAMMATSDPVTSIPLHRSTLRVLQRVKTAAETWDDFLLTITDDFVSPAHRSELDRRRARDPVIRGAQARREFEEIRRRAR